MLKILKEFFLSSSKKKSYAEQSGEKYIPRLLPLGVISNNYGSLIDFVSSLIRSLPLFIILPMRDSLYQ
jgi:hypothetical protein